MKNLVCLCVCVCVSVVYVHMCVACDVYLCVCVRDRGREKREKGERNFIYHLFNRLIERCEENEHSSAGGS